MTNADNIIARLQSATLDKDNCPYMDSETRVRIGLAREAKAEIERLRDENRKMNTTIANDAVELFEQRAEIEQLQIKNSERVERYIYDNVLASLEAVRAERLQLRMELAAERERCAKIAETYFRSEDYRHVGTSIAYEIRKGE